MKVFDQQKLLNFISRYSKEIGPPVVELKQGVTGRLLETLKWLGHYDEYYTVVNLKLRCLDWHYGINKHLGYTTNDITGTKTENQEEDKGIIFLRNIIHPFARDWHNMFMVSTLKLFKNSDTKKFQLRNTRFIINIPVKKKNGIYVFVKQMMLPLQTDKDGNLVSYLNVYTIVDEYRGQPFRPRFFENIKNPKVLENIRQDMQQKHKKIAALEIDIQQKGNFSAKEFEFMDAFLSVYGTEKSWKKSVGKKLEITPDTVRWYTTNAILEKIQVLFVKPYLKRHEATQSDNHEIFSEVMGGFESAVIFLKKSGILSVLRECYQLRSKIIDKQYVNF